MRGSLPSRERAKGQDGRWTRCLRDTEGWGWGGMRRAELSKHQENHSASLTLWRPGKELGQREHQAQVHSARDRHPDSSLSAEGQPHRPQDRAEAAGS